MGNIKDFQNEWKRYSEHVNAANEACDSVLARLKDYDGEKADEERREAISQRDKAITSAQSEARYRFNQILNRMASKVDGIAAVSAITEDAMRALEMLKMRDKITPKEAEDAATMCDGNDAALETLQQLLKTRGGFTLSSVHKHKGKRGQAQDALREFRESVGYCLAWRGGSRDEITRQRAEEFLTHASTRTPIAAAFAADVDPLGSEYDFAKSIIGGHATYDGALLID